MWNLKITFWIFLLFTIVVGKKWKHAYDYIIVGGGSAGCVLANRLSVDPYVQVLLLEAGTIPDDPFVPVPRTFFSTWLNPETDWGFFTEPQPNTLKKEALHWSQAKMLGGGSSHNALHAERGSPHDYDGWRNLGNKGWSYEDVLPYFKKSENMVNEDLANNGYHGIHGPIEIKTTPKDPVLEKFIVAADNIGYDEVIDYNSANMQGGFSHMQINVNKKGFRASTYEGYLRPVIGRHNLDVITTAFVTKINIDKRKRAEGVYFDYEGQEKYVKASKEVIISAGTMNSPKILMLSGIGPKKHLDDMKIDNIVDLPVGQNLQDHPAVYIPIPIDPNSEFGDRSLNTFKTLFEYVFTGKGPWSSPDSSIISFFKSKLQPSQDLFPYIRLHIATNSLTLQPELVRSIVNGSGIIPELVEDLEKINKLQVLDTFTIHLHPRKTGSIRIKSKDPFQNPVIDFPYIDDSNDIADFIESIRRLQSIIDSPMLKDIGILPITAADPSCSNVVFDSDDYWACYVRANVFSFNHYSGTCKMANDKSGVVDDKLRVKGVTGLRVIDISTVPQIPSGSTNLPAMMIAEKGADMILKS